MRGRKAKPATVERVEQITMIADGFDRNRTYTREEICRRFNHEPTGTAAAKRAGIRNANRFFRDNFLRRGLPAWPVGKTYLVTGEALFVWTAANAHRIKDD